MYNSPIPQNKASDIATEENLLSFMWLMRYQLENVLKSNTILIMSRCHEY